MLPEILRKELFWDMDTTKMETDKNQRIIIERVLSYGNLVEFTFIKKQ